MESEVEKKRCRWMMNKTPEERQAVARKGGLAASADRARMAEIGRKGGLSVSQDRAHMAEIGRKGGAASRGGGRRKGNA